MLLVIDEVNEEEYYIHTNVQGNVVAISDDTGAVRETFAYDIYGRLTAATAWNGDSSAAVDEIDGFVDMADYYADSIIDNEILFQGRRYDRESGLYYFRHRQYDPQHGSFLTRDPMGYRDSHNLYQFVNNNPIAYTDPMGLEASPGDNKEEKIQDATEVLEDYCEEQECLCRAESGDCTETKCKAEARKIAEVYVETFYKAAVFDFENYVDIHKGWMCYQWTYIVKTELRPVVGQFSCWSMSHVGITEKLDDGDFDLPHNYVLMHLGTIKSENGPCKDCSAILDPWNKEGDPRVYDGTLGFLATRRLHIWDYILDESGDVYGTGEIWSDDKWIPWTFKHIRKVTGDYFEEGRRSRQLYGWWPDEEARQAGLEDLQSDQAELQRLRQEARQRHNGG